LWKRVVEYSLNKYKLGLKYFPTARNQVNDEGLTGGAKPEVLVAFLPLPSEGDNKLWGLGTNERFALRATTFRRIVRREQPFRQPSKTLGDENPVKRLESGVYAPKLPRDVRVASCQVMLGNAQKGIPDSAPNSHSSASFLRGGFSLHPNSSVNCGLLGHSHSQTSAGATLGIFGKKGLCIPRSKIICHPTTVSSHTTNQLLFGRTLRPAPPPVGAPPNRKSRSTVKVSTVTCEGRWEWGDKVFQTLLTPAPLWSIIGCDPFTSGGDKNFRKATNPFMLFETSKRRNEQSKD